VNVIGSHLPVAAITLTDFRNHITILCDTPSIPCVKYWIYVQSDNNWLYIREYDVFNPIKYSLIGFYLLILAWEKIFNHTNITFLSWFFFPFVRSWTRFYSIFSRTLLFLEMGIVHSISNFLKEKKLMFTQR